MLIFIGHLFIQQNFIKCPLCARHCASCEYRMVSKGTSLVVQWLRLCASTAGAQVRSLVGELRSHMPLCMAKGKKSKNGQ